MSDREATVQTSESETRRPNWWVIGIVAAATIFVALFAIIAFRALLSDPPPALGATPAAELQLGSCLAEAETDLASYTVVDCASPHPQQVVGTVDIGIRSVAYTQYTAVTVFAREVCNRYLEYSLFVRDEITPEDYTADAIAIPTETQYKSGQDQALCVVAAGDGSQLTESVYRALP